MKSVLIRGALCFKNPLSLVLSLLFFVAPIGLCFESGNNMETLNDTFLLGMMCTMMGSIIAMSLFAEDDKSGWDKFMATMPVPAGRVIVGRYLFTLALVLLYVLSATVPSVALMLKGSGFDVKEWLFVFSVLLGISVFMLSLTLPISVRFGNVAGIVVSVSVFMLLVFGGVIVSAMLVKNEQGITVLGDLIKADRYVLSAAIIGACAVFLGLSMVISVSLMKRKEY